MYDVPRHRNNLRQHRDATSRARKLCLELDSKVWREVASGSLVDVFHGQPYSTPCDAHNLDFDRLTATEQVSGGVCSRALLNVGDVHHSYRP